MSSLPPPPDKRKLTLATLTAALIALLVLVTAILPAEFGLDPTGTGRLLGIDKLRSSGGARDVAEDTAERDTFTLQARWSLYERRLPVIRGNVDPIEPDGATATIPINDTNVTRLSARLDWQGDPADPNTIALQIQAPNARRSVTAYGKVDKSREGTATTTLFWVEAPVPRFSGQGLLVNETPDTSAQGEWRVNARLVNPTTSNLQPWTLTVTIETYALNTSITTGPTDKVTLTLLPERGIEYKFGMPQNGTLRYAWRASEPIMSELHADHYGNPEDYTTFRAKLAQSDEGTHVAPFEGRHGWYWRNPTSKTVTIELETSGDYTIIGVPR